MKNVKTDITFAFSTASHAYAIVSPKSNDAALELTLEADRGETMAIKLVDDSGMPVEGAAGVNQYFNAFHNEHDIDMEVDGLFPVSLCIFPVGDRGFAYRGSVDANPCGGLVTQPETRSSPQNDATVLFIEMTPIKL